MDQRTLQIILKLKDEISSQLKGVSTQLESMKPAFKTMATVGTAAFVGVAGAIALSVKEAAESDKIHSQLNAVLKSTGSIAGVTADQAIKLAESLKKVTIYDDDAILSGENLLLTFTNIGKDVFPEATQTMLDMSAALGQDLKSSAMQLGKALQDPIQGVAALRRVGVNFSDAQIDVITKLVETGQEMEAQKYILKELNTEFGGSSEINDFGDRMEKLKQSVGDAEKAIGHALIPVLEDLYKKLEPIITNVTSWIESNPELTTQILIVSAAVTGLVAGVGLFGLALPAIITGVTALGTILTFLAANPVVLVLAALAFLVLKFKELMDLTGGFSGAISAMGDTLKSWWDASGQWIYDKIQGLINLFSKAIEYAGKLAGGALNYVSGMLPGKASGGSVNAGGAYMVGENGPERFVPRSSGSIVPNGALGMASAGGVNVYVYGDITGDEIVEKVKAALGGEVKRRMRTT